jgi:hypothetical protein
MEVYFFADNKSKMKRGWPLGCNHLRRGDGTSMLSHKELEKIREEREVIETWRRYSRHVVAEMLEVCAVCGIVREKVRLARCRWCDDTYVCKDGKCTQRHQAEVHPAVAFWTWQQQEKM